MTSIFKDKVSFKHIGKVHGTQKRQYFGASYTIGIFTLIMDGYTELCGDINNIGKMSSAKECYISPKVATKCTHGICAFPCWLNEALPTSLPGDMAYLWVAQNGSTTKQQFQLHYWFFTAFPMQEQGRNWGNYVRTYAH